MVTDHAGGFTGAGRLRAFLGPAAERQGRGCEHHHFLVQLGLPHSLLHNLLVVVVIVLWDKNVMLLKESSKVLANERPDIEKGDHDGEHTEKAKGHFHRFGQNGAAASNDD